MARRFFRALLFYESVSQFHKETPSQSSNQVLWWTDPWGHLSSCWNSWLHVALSTLLWSGPVTCFQPTECIKDDQMDGGMLFHKWLHSYTWQNYSTHLPGVSLLLLDWLWRSKLPWWRMPILGGPHDKRNCMQLLTADRQQESDSPRTARNWILLTTWVSVEASFPNWTSDRTPAPANTLTAILWNSRQRT